MKMTAEEIVKIYKSDPSKETMQQLAIDNDCTLKDIGEFLKAAAAAKTEEIQKAAEKLQRKRRDQDVQKRQKSQSLKSCLSM